jgi:hypothetical protein
MTKDNLIQLMKKPEMLDDKSIEAIDGLIYEYPYFQSAHVLYLLNLKKNESSKYSLRLPSSAAYSADRKKLYCTLNGIDTKWINKQDDSDNHPPIASSPVAIKQTDEPEEIFLIDDSKGAGIENEVIFETLPPISTTDEEKLPELLELETPERQDKNTEKAKPALDTNKIDAPAKNISQKEDRVTASDYFSNEPGTIEEEIKGVDLIEKFLIEKPSMPKLQTLKQEKKSREEEEITDYSLNSVEEKDDFITETLAKLYLEQENYEKAVETYKKLSLKYPEKSVYFASQIEKIEKNNLNI